MNVVDRHLRELDRIFRSHDKHAAQQRSQQVLLDAASNKSFLKTVLQRHVSEAEKLNTGNFPSLGFTIATTARYTLVANAFFPLPTGETDITTNSVHHHGEMLLTTVTAFGPGYDHWRFTTPEVFDRDRDLFRMRLLDRKQHALGHSAFVDAFMPHAVMFPAQLSITYALWSSRRRTSWRDHLKRLRAFRGSEKRIRAFAARVGLRRALDLKLAEYYDYYPRDGAFCGMRERIQFQRGPNEDYLQSLFNVLQETGNEELARAIERTVNRGGVERPAYLRTLLDKMKRGEPIAHRFSEGIHVLPHMNFKAAAIQATLGLG